MANDTQRKASEAADKASEAAESAVGDVKDAGRYMKDKVNEGVRSVGEYFNEHDIRDMAGDVSNLVRRHPLMSVAVGVGIGLLFASVLRR